jgi:uncharacterized protein (DUF2384 family)
MSSTAAGFSYASIVEELRSWGVTSADIARATGVRERQVQHWAAGSSRPRDETRDRLVDVNYLVSKLADVYRPEGVEIWLHARNRALGGQRPIDMLAASEFQPVVRLVEQLASGAM